MREEILLLPFAEEFLPNLVQFKGENWLAVLIDGYRKEIGIQARYGGIRHPQGTLHNKIRHLLTNYDDVRECLKIHRHTISIDRYVQILRGVIKRISKLVQNLPLPEKITLPGNQTLLRSQVLDYNRTWEYLQLKELRQLTYGCL